MMIIKIDNEISTCFDYKNINQNQLFDNLMD